MSIIQENIIGERTLKRYDVKLRDWVTDNIDDAKTTSITKRFVISLADWANGSVTKDIEITDDYDVLVSVPSGEEYIANYQEVAACGISVISHIGTVVTIKYLNRKPIKDIVLQVTARKQGITLDVGGSLDLTDYAKKSDIPDVSGLATKAELDGKSDTSHNHNGTYVPVSASCNKNWNWSGQSGQPTWLWGSNDGTNMYVYNPSNFSVNYANSAGSVAWNNVSGKPSSYTPSSHTHDDRYYTESEVNSLLGGKSDTSHTHSNYLTGITKAMVTNALGYTPPTSDTNTTYSAGTNLSLSGTTFNVSSTPSFTSITLNGYTVTVD